MNAWSAVLMILVSPDSLTTTVAVAESDCTPSAEAVTVLTSRSPPSTSSAYSTS